MSTSSPFVTTEELSGARRAVIHCGVHKTASTAFQALCRHHAPSLLQHGVYFETVEPYPAHHALAWSILDQNDTVLTETLARMPKRCQDILLSSEDFENLLYDPETARWFDTKLKTLGFSEIEYYFVLRQTGPRFASVVSEMCKHGVYLDWFHCLDEVMRTGLFTVPRASPATTGIPGGWHFVFDYYARLSAFEKAVSGSIKAVSFDADGPFPGATILERAFGITCQDWLADAGTDIMDIWRNPRKPADFQTQANAELLLTEMALDDSAQEKMSQIIAARLPDEETQQLLCRTLDDRFPIEQALFDRYS